MKNFYSDKKTISYGEWKRLLERGDRETRIQLARRSDIPNFFLIALAADPDSEVRSVARANKLTTKSVINIADGILNENSNS